MAQALSVLARPPVLDSALTRSAPTDIGHAHRFANAANHASRRRKTSRARDIRASPRRAAHSAERSAPSLSPRPPPPARAPRGLQQLCRACRTTSRLPPDGNASSSEGTPDAASSDASHPDSTLRRPQIRRPRPRSTAIPSRCKWPTAMDDAGPGACALAPFLVVYGPARGPERAAFREWRDAKCVRDTCKRGLIGTLLRREHCHQ